MIVLIVYTFCNQNYIIFAKNTLANIQGYIINILLVYTPIVNVISQSTTVCSCMEQHSNRNQSDLFTVYVWLTTSVRCFYVSVIHLIHQLIMQLSNQPITWQLLHLGVWSWSRQSSELQTECQNGK